MTQGERIKDIRKSLNMTLEDFGAKVGVTKQTISRIENGINNVTDQMSKAICREFSVNYDYLVSGEGDMFSDLPHTMLDELCVQYDCDDFDKYLIEEYLRLSQDERGVIKKYVQNIFDRRKDVT